MRRAPTSRRELRAILRRHEDGVFAAWLAAGGIDATMGGEPYAALLLDLLGDVDEAATLVSLNEPQAALEFLEAA